MPDPGVPYEETVGAFAELQRAGKVRHIGVSNVTLEHLQSPARCARSCPCRTPTTSVPGPQSSCWQRARGSGNGVSTLEADPARRHARCRRGRIDRGLTRDHRRQQVALAWALAHSPAMLPIPGTSKLHHLDENIDAAFIELSKDEIARLESAAAPA